MNTLVVLADSGSFKAFSLEDTAVNSSPRLQPLDATRMKEGDDRIGRTVTDDAGQYRKSKGRFAVNGDRSDGEQHNIWLENERRSVKEIAERLSALLADGQFESCYLAAPGEFNKKILEHLSPQARSKIQKNLQCDLVNAPRNEILQHFNN
jgi:hypothetical protein